MTISTKTVLDLRELLPDGTLQVRLAKQVMKGSEVMTSEYHRAIFTPGCEVRGTMDAVDLHLAGMGYPPVPPADWDKVANLIALEWTDEVVQAYAAARHDPG